MSDLKLTLALVMIFHFLSGISQTNDKAIIDKIVNKINYDKGLKGISVTDPKYLDEMADFNGSIIGYFNKNDLRKVYVFSQYGQEIYEYSYYLFENRLIYSSFHVSETDETSHKSRLKFIRGDEIYFKNEKAILYRYFSNGKWASLELDSPDVRIRTQNILDDIRYYERELKNSWLKQ